MDHAIAYTWTEHHQLASVKSLAGEFRYQYAENNPALLTQMTSPVHRVATTREPKRDLIAEVSNVGLMGLTQSRRGAEPNPEVEKKSVASVASVVNPISSYAYTNDGLGRRTSIAMTGAAFDRYSAPQTVGVSYNERGEVVGADYVSKEAPAKGAASYRYQYDAIGNRQRHSRQAPDAAKPEITTYESNALNQYQSVQSGPSMEHPTHDLDGNLLENAEFRYEWDSENRLIAAEKKDRTQRVTYVYDSQSRLVARRAQVPARDDARTWVPAQESHYLYDGWNRLAELTLDPRGEKATNGAIHTNEPLQDNAAPPSSFLLQPSAFNLQPSTFLTWGRDLSGSQQGAGGVGGLLAATEIKPAPAQSASKESTSLTALARSHYFLYDANGNVTQIVDAAGRLAAHYEYDPFGNVTKTGGGELALSNPWRFSTKAQDFATRLVYYGYRFYAPGVGRWPNSDPINEPGFKVFTHRAKPFNLKEEKILYAFVGNDGVNRWDNLGLYGGVNYPIPGYNIPIRLKRCGTAVSRAIFPADDPTLWEKFHETVSGVVYPHEFVILDDGTRLTHGGTADGEDHRTARKTPIYIDPCKSCKEFTKCMKDNWPDDSQYTPCSHNCGYAVRSVVSKCDGLINPPFWAN